MVTLSTMAKSARPIDTSLALLKREMGISQIVVATAIILAASIAGRVQAQSCSTTSLPYSLNNGSTADASQVMADLNCAAFYGLANANATVRIGNTTTGAPLTVQGYAGWGIQKIIASNTNGEADIGFHSINVGDGATGDWLVGVNIVGVNKFSIYSASQGGVLNINPTGEVGIGTTSPPYLFYVNGQAGGTTAWANSSDARLKQDVVGITNALPLVQRLRGVRFKWKPADKREVGKDLVLPQDETEMGFIAQEVAKVVPEAVTAPKKADGIYSLKEPDLIPLLVEAIKEQQQEIELQKKEIIAIKSQLSLVTKK